MGNTYHRIYIHIVFAVKGRISLIRENVRESVQKYITGIVKECGHKPLSIYCMPDHVHILIGLNPDKALSGLVREVKSGSSKHIHDTRMILGRFEWQEGYGAFSYSHSHLDRVIQYIQNQPVHHKRRLFLDEFRGFLHKYNIDYDETYLPDQIEDDTSRS